MSESLAQKMSDGTLVIDSRVVASELELNHSDWVQNIIKKHQKQAEIAFGILRFENGEIKGRGQPEKFVWLTEEQSLFYLTLSRNTKKVVETKVKLIAEFSKLKKILSEQGYREVTSSVYITRLERSRDHIIDDDLWCIFKEGAEVLLLVEKEFKVPVQKMDLCDGSIGSNWMKYRKDKLWIGEVKNYIHKFPDHRPDATPNAFELKELPYFRKWLREEYEPKLLPKYLADKYGKRAVLQIYQEQNKIDNYILELTKEKKKGTKQEEYYNTFLAMREAIESRQKYIG